MPHFPLECLADEQVHAQIKRFDGLYFNPTTKKFEDDTSLKIQLTKGESPHENVWRANPEIERTGEFTPGRYVVYYYAGDKICTAVYESTEKDLIIPSPTDVAIRIASIQTVDGDLRKSINKISKQLSAIEKHLGLPPIK